MFILVKDTVDILEEVLTFLEYHKSATPEMAKELHTKIKLHLEARKSPKLNK